MGVVGTLFDVFSGLMKFWLGMPVVGRTLNILLATGAMLVRLGAGGKCASGLDRCKRPEKTLIVYEYEACPFCRKVREALTTLDLDAIVYPCPRLTTKTYGVTDGSRYRPTVIEMDGGGKAIFPFLVDENTGTKMYESDKIVEYLWATYGEHAVAPLNDRVANGGPWKIIGLMLASGLRIWDAKFGMLRTPSKLPDKPLELWGTEASPFCKMAREALCTLELPYKCVNVGHGSTKKRAEFKARFGDQLSSLRKSAGLIMIPLLVDPNTDTIMVESADIVDYLFAEYQKGETVNESMSDYSTDGASASHGTVPFASKSGKTD